MNTPATPEPTVPVPVSLIRATIDSLKSWQDDGRYRAKQLEALLSQPNPTAEPPSASVDIEGFIAALPPMPDPVDDFGGANLFIPPTAAPPSIAYMASGTTFASAGGTFTVMDSFGDRWLQKDDGDAWDIDDIDPSTIRDVTPPNEH